MKAYERILVYGLLLAVAGLYILQFSGSPATAEPAENLDTLSASESVNMAHGRGVIYYVNTDSLWDEYDYVKDIFKKLESKKSQFEGQIEKQVREFEREYMSLQEKARTMSEMELQIKQQDLMKKEQEIGKLKEDLEIKFMNDEKEWNDKLREEIIGYIREYTKDRDYDYVLGYSVTSNIILTNDSLNLTKAVLDGLNAKYATQNSKK